MKRKKFCQRLVASIEGLGPFITVCIITRPARRREVNEVLTHYYINSASVWIFGSLLTNSRSKHKSDGTRNFAQGGKYSLHTGARLYEFFRHLEYHL